MVVVEDPLSALAAWWLFPYSSVAAVGGKSELASIDPVELPPHSLVRIFTDEDYIAGSPAGKAERRVASAGFDVQLGSHEWEFNTDLKGRTYRANSRSRLHRALIGWEGQGPRQAAYIQENGESHFVREEAEAWRPFLDPGRGTL